MTRPIVIGVGNRFRRDDGLGLEVAERLDGAVAGCDVALADGEPARLMELWRDRPLAVVVDAMRSGAGAGTVTRLELGLDELPARSARASSHAVGVTEAAALGRAVACLPGRLVLFGVEAAALGDGEGLSAPVAAALNGVVARIREEVLGRCV
ncbi:MAG: hydrogenase maturation protease [Acidimicrobiales bacterium]|nr:hydrogenase maturation protease [Acidimicrobiales bacterium]